MASEHNTESIKYLHYHKKTSYNKCIIVINVFISIINIIINIVVIVLVILLINCYYSIIMSMSNTLTTCTVILKLWFAAW